MSAFPRRVIVVVLAIAMTMSLAGTAGAATLRTQPRETRPNPDVVLYGSGWGHGVGMSQFGAYAQSRAGWGYRRILQYYYSGIAIAQRTMPKGIRVGLHTDKRFYNVDAVTGQVPWRALVNGSWITKPQPAGTTWTVSRTSTGAFRLTRASDGTIMWTIKATRLLAAFNPNAKTDGTVVEAYNPNYDERSHYKWGRLEFSPSLMQSGEINLVLDIPSIELYLRGLAESMSSWGLSGGDAALKAQAVVGRSYAMVLRGSSEANCRCQILATPRNQTYLGWDHESGYAGSEWVSAVRGTAGVVATYNGVPIEAFYSSSHGGRSENIEDSWAYDSYRGYVRSVADPWSVNAPGNTYASWEYTTSNASFARFVGSTIAKVRSIRIAGRTDGGSPRALRVSGINGSGGAATAIRSGTRGIAAIDLKLRYGLRSQQVRRIGLAPFVDDDGAIYEYANVYVYRAGVMDDIPAPRFRPRYDVTRGRAALYLYRLLRLPAATRTYYDDISGRPAAERAAINALAAAGISGGLKTRKFSPTNDLTRAQLAVFLRNALGMSKTSTSGDYYDDDDGIAAEAAINRVASWRLMTACGTRRFCPGRAVTRGGMASALFATAEKLR